MLDTHMIENQVLAEAEVQLRTATAEATGVRLEKK
jgi:hypothetical protein